MEFPDDPERVELLDLLWAHDLVLGNESEATRRHRRNIERRYADSQAAQFRMKSLFAASAERELHRPAASAGDWPHAGPLETGPGKKKKPAVPSRPATPKPYPGVGRNDPCPRSSGKKFKKCCDP